ncbi:MAG: AbrB/MazE/SpoVT family DNA-binding domain-containing protein [Candidatus Kapaibacteriales bacterium]
MYIQIRIYIETMEMTTKIFKSGNSQAVRLPKEFKTDLTQFYIRKIGSSILLTPTKGSWDTVEQSLGMFSDDFLEEGRKQPPMQERVGF